MRSTDLKESSMSRALPAILALSFALLAGAARAHLVTPVTALNGLIQPTAPQDVATGETATFTIAANVGYTVTVGGSCPAGSFVGVLYTTGPITADCTVAPAFSVAQFTVTPSAGAGGTIAPSTAQTVNY